ncbi:MAG: zinc ribbon domain-containing protein, partial [Pyrinomonadaceae bacterium]|nr:zinc ribbon domain-containing protein [Pyrinomonadaceae bacterium]
MSFCHECGAKVAPDDPYCGNCGTALHESEPHSLAMAVAGEGERGGDAAAQPQPSASSELDDTETPDAPAEDKAAENADEDKAAQDSEGA